MPGDNEFVFREGRNGLEFVGDFEGLYQAQADPWQQSGEAPYTVQQYYTNARAQLVGAIQRRVSGKARGLEVGCGHGHVVDLLSGIMESPLVDVSSWEGTDISRRAITRACELYPQHRFFVSDITQRNNCKSGYGVIVLGQVLWYVMHRMNVVVENCHRMLRDGGILIISQAFLTGEQRYGREIADGFDGALRLMLTFRDQFQLIEARYEDRLGLAHHDGLIIMRKKC